MTPAARSVIEAVHAGAILTMHYRREDSGENVRRFVLEPKGKVVFAPTAILAVRSGHLKAVDDGLPGLAVTQTWTAGEPLLPEREIPFVDNSRIRDTAIPGLTVKFVGTPCVYRGETGKPFSDHVVLHAASGLVLVQADNKRWKCGKRDVVKRVDASRLAEIDWAAVDERMLKGGWMGDHHALMQEAEQQIRRGWGAAAYDDHELLLRLPGWTFPGVTEADTKAARERYEASL